MRITNKKVIDSMKELIKNSLCYNDFKRYVNEFYNEYDYNIYQYGNLDCYDYDLYVRLVNFRVDTKAIKEYSKVLDWGCTAGHRVRLRETYTKLVRLASNSLIKDILNNKITEKDFIS